MADYINFWTIFFCALELIVMIGIYWFLHRKKKFKLHLLLSFNNKQNPFIMSLNTITLTDTLTHKGVISVTDAAGNTYQGTLANITVAVADPTMDQATVDQATPNTIDVTDVSPQGGTVANIVADFTSVGNATPAAGSTAQSIPDGIVFTGLKGSATIINAIPSTVQLSLAVNF